jgi:hypothetical protein
MLFDRPRVFPRPFFLGDIIMRPLHRGHVNKRRSVRKFKHQAKRTKRANISGLARGGIRL